MKLHLVGGFLGSGKTTAIIQASRLLMEQGKRVGVVTNDQGKYLVDTAFVRLADVPTVEVTGGCFCCNYGDLDTSLDEIITDAKPDVVFAESVGSCADLVATVVKPLLKLKQAQAGLASFSVFADARLLRRRLADAPMPFSEDVVYIYDKQLEEAGLVVVNKMDLVQPEVLAETLRLFGEKFPDKAVLAQTSLQPSGVLEWLRLLDKGAGLLPGASLEIDYARYGHGEAQLAWLDEEVYLSGPDLGAAVRGLIEGFAGALRERNAAVGHLKFLLRAGDTETKISLTTLEHTGWAEALPKRLGEEARLLVNARIEMPAEELRRLFFEILGQSGAVYEENGVSFFHPRQPRPTYRMD